MFSVAHVAPGGAFAALWTGLQGVDVELRKPLRRESASLSRVDEATDLLRRCQAGDRHAFRELFERHRLEVTRLVYRMTHGSQDLEDLVQEVFIQVHKSLPTFRSEARLSTWIFRIAVNVVLMHRRAARTRPLMLLSKGEPVLVDTTVLPDDQLARQRRVEALHRLLEQVGEKKRIVYFLHELQGLSPQEIALVVGAPVLTVRTRLFYARREVLALLRTEPALAAIADGIVASEPPGAPEPQKEPA
jgi:RNA polymerase sigma-70 factor (ECF subfamily)